MDGYSLIFRLTCRMTDNYDLDGLSLKLATAHLEQPLRKMPA
jgi:hypothetical protein